MSEQLARGLFADFAPHEQPFAVPNGMEDNLRLIDDHLGLYTLQPPVAVGTPVPANPQIGDGQIFEDGTYAVYNAQAWKFYPARRGIYAVLAGGTDSWFATGRGWNSYVKIAADLATSAAQESFADPSGSSRIGFLQRGAGAGPRPLQDKAQDTCSVLDFDATAYRGNNDATPAFVKALLQSDTVDVPKIGNGTYLLSSVTLGTNNRLRGVGRPTITDQAGATGQAMIYLCKTGFTQYVALENLYIKGTGIAGRVGVMADANYDAGNLYQGGTWYSELVNIRVDGWASHQIWFRGGTYSKANPSAPSGNLQPNQFIKMSNVRAQAANAGAYALLLSGQNGQFEIGGASLFQHTAQIDKAVHVTRFMDNTGTETGDDGRAYSIAFMPGVSFQKGKYGLHVKRAFGVRCYGVYMEQNNYSVFADLTTEEMYFDGQISAQINDGANGDYAIRAANGSVGGAATLKVGPTYLFGGGSIGVDGGQMTGVTLEFLAAPSFNGGSWTSQFKNCTYQASIVGTTLNAYSHSSAYLSGGTLDTINSSLPPGKALTVLVGPAGATINSTGNITLGSGRLSVPIPGRSAVTLMRVDLGGTWILMQAP
jgi:hypothetical protein